MNGFKSASWPWVIPLLFVAACSTDDGDGKPNGNSASAGSFQVSLVEPTPISQGYTSVLGTVFNGPTPASLKWSEAAKSGACRLMTPKAPFCETPCGSGAACVDDNKCQDYPKTIGVGRVSVQGLKTQSGAASFTMDPILGSYQPPSGTTLAYPPFAEGDAVQFSASGDSTAAFSISAKGISPLAVLNDTITLADGKPVKVEWTPAKPGGNSSIFIRMDISHHGGVKGVVECEGADNGSLEIAATLVDQLKALGISGFPKIEVTRRTTGTHAGVHVDLVIESMITKSLSIPGVVSCFGPEDCPSGQTCGPDARCR